jgi:glycosyltransferase involved in cell wall biosynthesis
LAGAIETALASTGLKPVDVAPTSQPYWDARSHGEHDGRPGVAPDAGSRLAVVIPNFKLAPYLPRALRSLSKVAHLVSEVVIVDDGSDSAVDASILAALPTEFADDFPVKILSRVVNEGLSTARNAGVAATTSEFVLFLDADDLIVPRFVEEAITLLQRVPGVDGVLPQLAYFQTVDQIADDELTSGEVSLGLTALLGHGNFAGPATLIARRTLLEEFPYDASLPLYEDWDLYLRLFDAGKNIVAWNYIGVFVQVRDASMRASADDVRKQSAMGTVLENHGRRHGLRPWQVPLALRY